MSRPVRTLLFLIPAACGLLLVLSRPDTLEANESKAANRAPSLVSTKATDAGASDPVPSYNCRIIRIYPHDRFAFTQGLVFEDGFLYEGTGLCGHSSLRKVGLETGKILERRDLAPEFFGEGITLYQNRIIQLTWQSGVGFVYDKGTFELIKVFTYPMEGWGITHDGRRLIMSDGTAILHLLDPETFVETGQIEVRDDHGPVPLLNELEYIKGEIYANVWQTNRIARISPRTGKVIGWIDLDGLLRPEDCEELVDVLNGIAYDTRHDRLFVTGKYWPRLFEIALIAPAP